MSKKTVDSVPAEDDFTDIQHSDTNTTLEREAKREDRRELAPCRLGLDPAQDWGAEPPSQLSLTYRRQRSLHPRQHRPKNWTPLSRGIS
ncbi:unnamed protein product [Nezara viridula]|uniref:Uncharacterized protein n=1 Tax=Nezara viridula TaxID=85310 RepID=A0A9P0H5Z6_NEZVI|nr:unnamed protein product [Nezara viridula]